MTKWIICVCNFCNPYCHRLGPTVISNYLKAFSCSNTLDYGGKKWIDYDVIFKLKNWTECAYWMRQGVVHCVISSNHLCSWAWNNEFPHLFTLLICKIIAIEMLLGIVVDAVSSWERLAKQQKTMFTVAEWRQLRNVEKCYSSCTNYHTSLLLFYFLPFEERSCFNTRRYDWRLHFWVWNTKQLQNTEDHNISVTTL